MNGTPGAVVLAGLERLVDAALRLDAATQRRLTELAGKVIHIECTTPAFDVFLLPQPGRLALAGQWHAPADARLSGSADGFARLLASPDPAAELINGPLAVYGDSQALQRLQRILRDLDIDWEAPLSRLLGDVAGHALGRTLRRGARQVGYAGERVMAQGRDWLNEESELVANRWHVTRFCNDVDELAERVDRLEARLRQLRRGNRVAKRA